RARREELQHRLKFRPCTQMGTLNPSAACRFARWGNSCVSWIEQMTTDRYDPDRDITPKFLETVNSWIEASGEVLVILRYLRAAGARDFGLIDSADRFLRLVEVCPRGTDIIVCRDAPLPLRGRVDDDFIARAKDFIPAGGEYLFVCLEP